MKKILGLLVILGISGCLKQELPVQMNGNNHLNNGIVEMGTSYAWQCFYDLSSNQVVGRNNKFDWDLAFSRDFSNQWQLHSNAARAMYVAVMDKSFESLTDTIGFGKEAVFEIKSVPFDSAGIALKVGMVLLVDRGVDASGAKSGWVKLEVVELTDDEISFRMAALDQTVGIVKTLMYRSDYNATFYSIDQEGEVLIEPKKNSWDLCFTQYLHLFEEEHIDYLVTGCLLNPSGVNASMVSDEFSFEDLNYEAAIMQTLTNELDVIGYQWKFFDGNAYQVDPEKIYLITDLEGYFYKLRFVDFYNEKGEKGHPTFEQVQL